MKKILAILLAVTMMFSLVACGETNDNPTNKQDDTSNVTPSQSITPDRDYDESDPTAVLGEITNDFADVTTQLTEKLTDTFSAVGTTCEDYQKNKELVDEWIALVLSDSDALLHEQKKTLLHTSNLSQQMKIISTASSVMMLWMSITMLFTTKQWTNTMTLSMMMQWMTSMMNTTMA